MDQTLEYFITELHPEPFSFFIFRQDLTRFSRLASDFWSLCLSFQSSWCYKCVSPASGFYFHGTLFKTSMIYSLLSSGYRRVDLVTFIFFLVLGGKHFSHPPLRMTWAVWVLQMSMIRLRKFPSISSFLRVPTSVFMPSWVKAKGFWRENWETNS